MKRSQMTVDDGHFYHFIANSCWLLSSTLQALSTLMAWWTVCVQGQIRDYYSASNFMESNFQTPIWTEKCFWDLTWFHRLLPRTDTLLTVPTIMFCNLSKKGSSRYKINSTPDDTSWRQPCSPLYFVPMYIALLNYVIKSV